MLRSGGCLVVADCDQNQFAHRAGAREICHPNVGREGLTVGRGATLQGMLPIKQVEHWKLRVARADVAGRQPNVDLALFVEEVCVELALDSLTVEEFGFRGRGVVPVFDLERNGHVVLHEVERVRIRRPVPGCGLREPGATRDFELDDAV